MAEIEKILDEEASKLYQQLHGIDEKYSKDRLAEGLEKQKEQEDEKRAPPKKLAVTFGSAIVALSVNPCVA